MADDPMAGFLDDFNNGTPAPAVDPSDIRRMWEFMSRLKQEHPNIEIAGSAVFRTVRSEDVYAPKANVGAVWVRAGLIDILLRTGELKPWVADSDYEKRVYEVAAAFPMRVGTFDGEEFLRLVGVQR